MVNAAGRLGIVSGTLAPPTGHSAMPQHAWHESGSASQPLQPSPATQRSGRRVSRVFTRPSSHHSQQHRRAISYSYDIRRSCLVIRPGNVTARDPRFKRRLVLCAAAPCQSAPSLRCLIHQPHKECF
ncbi:hypothetical protein E2C01_050079 [Portunus trituberculatus]|uniref:Uncharacterized protein n=1 Tax=Portunus trituberculatus TaxID=210409 RepID=A0A5B7GEX6_PORTR|nr:hypothetical protein [Portunus trituberculatus]